MPGHAEQHNLLRIIPHGIRLGLNEILYHIAQRTPNYVRYK